VTGGGLACYPGSFNPPTVAHLAIARAARDACAVVRVDLVVSRVALDKEHVARPSLDERVDVLRSVAADAGPWLGVVVTEHQLLVDIARSYDVLVLGADKWAQVVDPRYYGGSVEARDAAVAALPAVAVVPRPGHDHVAVPAGATVLELPADVARASSTAARAGRHDLMVPQARASGLWSAPTAT
jgi:hypothetical protein